MMLKGKYVFKSNGEIIFEKDNVLTENGILMINRYLAGSSMDWAGSIALGAIGTTSASTDTKLAFETKRIPVILKSYITSGSVNQIVIKGTLEEPEALSIYEIGVIPLNYVVGADKDNFKITDFSEALSASQSLWVTSPIGSSATSFAAIKTSSRFGVYNITASSQSITSKDGFVIDVSNYTSRDYLELLYYVPSAGTSPSLTVTLYDSASSTWTSASTFLPTTSSGFYSASLAFNTKPSTFNDNVSKIELKMVSGTGSVTFDALKLMSGAVKPAELKLVSRTSSSAALVEKATNQPIDIEYYLTVM